MSEAVAVESGRGVPQRSGPRLRRWVLRPGSGEAAAALARELRVPPPVAEVLVRRGVCETQAAREFLEPRLATGVRSPRLFRDMERASRRVLEAVDRGEVIGIYGDYDVDGITGSAILIELLQGIGGKTVLHIPDRVRDGYGLNERGVRRLAEAGARVMITVDCGGASCCELKLARDLGMDAVVCDHHQVPEERPPALAVLNPADPREPFPFRGLSGAGVAFYLAMGVRMRLRELGRQFPDIRRWLDLVALGAIADLVPLREENRVLVRYGLEELRRTSRPGLVALREVSGCGSRMTTGAVGFRLAPRLNAGGRLSDARLPVELLLARDRAQAERLALELDAHNRERQAIEQRILRDAVEMVERSGGIDGRCGVVLASADWHPGVIGIVAARLVERYYRPAIVIAADPATGLARGSVRSIRGIDAYQALSQCAPCLEGYGGHPMAAGLTVRTDRVEELARRFDAAVRAQSRSDTFVPRLEIDAELDPAVLDLTLAEELSRLEPFGPGNPEPVFVARAVEVKAVRVVGERHLKMRLASGKAAVSAIGFGMGERRVSVGDRLDLAYSVTVSEWQGERNVELRIRDFRRARQ